MNTNITMPIRKGVEKNINSLCYEYDRVAKAAKGRGVTPWPQLLASRSIPQREFLLYVLWAHEFACETLRAKNWVHVVGGMVYLEFGVWLSEDQIRSLCSAKKAASHNSAYTPAMLHVNEVTRMSAGRDVERTRDDNDDDEDLSANPLSSITSRVVAAKYDDNDGENQDTVKVRCFAHYCVTLFGWLTCVAA